MDGMNLERRGSQILCVALSAALVVSFVPTLAFAGGNTQESVEVASFEGAETDDGEGSFDEESSSENPDAIKDSLGASVDDDGAGEKAASRVSEDEDSAVGDSVGIAKDELSESEKRQSADSLRSLSEEGSVLFQNDQGEYAYVPSEALTEGDLPAEVSPVASSVSSVVELGGADRYETVAKEALYAFSSSKTVVVASGVGYADSIAAAGLAGALGCPILLTGDTYVPEVTKDALKQLGAKDVVLLGSTSVANAGVEKTLENITGGKVTRIWGADRYATQMAIFDYGVKNKLWSGDTAILSAATGFADALSISPVSYALKIPVFFCDGSGYLPKAQEQALKSEYKARNFLITGSTVVVSSRAERFVQGLASARGGEAVRLAGSDRYATSQAIAEYAVKTLGFKWDGAAFASGQGPYDSLGGGVVQGREKSVLLLADAVNSSAPNVIVRNQGVVSTIKFFGSPVVVPTDVRKKICSDLSVSYRGDVVFTQYSVTRSAMAQMQVDRGEANGFGWSDFYAALDPAKHQYGTSAYYQFAVLNGGYSGVSAAALNGYVSDNCIYQEQNYGRSSNLRNAGPSFVKAAKQYGINEVYLLSHAIWESAWGCSELATGWTPSKDGVVKVNGKEYRYYKGTTYYNFYGIGAYDSNALSGGRAMAVKEGWTSPEKAILGAAKWIADNYVDRSDNRGNQNTLYLMKWDLFGAAKDGNPWHEYCTGLDSWVLGISRLMSACYGRAGESFDSTGLKFNVPLYSGS